MFFELFADTGAEERGPELGGSLTNMVWVVPSPLNPLWGAAAEGGETSECRYVPNVWLLD
jgi:hypothetical protein